MKQLQNERKQRVSGFTLIEIVIVVAIISILTAVLVPTMRGYLLKSNLNTANSEAKVLYNSIQTIMQEYEFKERQMAESAFYGTDKNGTLFIKGVNGNIASDDVIATSSGGLIRNGAAVKYPDGTTDIIGGNLASADADTFGARLSRLYSDYTTVSWAAYIEGYTVRGVFCAEDSNSAYVGGYPVRATQRAGEGEIACKVSAATKDILSAYSANAWTAGS